MAAHWATPCCNLHTYDFRTSSEARRSPAKVPRSPFLLCMRWADFRSSLQIPRILRSAFRPRRGQATSSGTDLGHTPRRRFWAKRNSWIHDATALGQLLRPFALHFSAFDTRPRPTGTTLGLCGSRSFHGASFRDRDERRTINPVMRWIPCLPRASFEPFSRWHRWYRDDLATIAAIPQIAACARKAHLARPWVDSSWRQGAEVATMVLPWRTP
jgi:hypothetical protein